MKTIIQINSLAEFQDEIDTIPYPVRLNVTERKHNKQLVPYLTTHVDLMGINVADQIVWLHWSRDFQFGGHADFAKMNPTGHHIYEQIPTMKTLIMEYLTEQGYNVKGGCFGIDQSITPVRGIFECVKWVTNPETGLYHVEHNDGQHVDL